MQMKASPKGTTSEIYKNKSVCYTSVWEFVRTMGSTFQPAFIDLDKTFYLQKRSNVPSWTEMVTNRKMQ